MQEAIKFVSIRLRPNHKYTVPFICVVITMLNLSE